GGVADDRAHALGDERVGQLVAQRSEHRGVTREHGAVDFEVCEATEDAALSRAELFQIACGRTDARAPLATGAVRQDEYERALAFEPAVESDFVAWVCHDDCRPRRGSP